MLLAPAAIAELVERFRHNRDRYHRADYNETQVRREFIDPLFEALGWDMDNQQRLRRGSYKDVIHEDAIKSRRRDQGARLLPSASAAQRKFFVEAKKPAVDIQRRRRPRLPAAPLRLVAPSCPLSILTDFEEFAVYDCRVKPGHARQGRHGARSCYLTLRRVRRALGRDRRGLLAARPCCKARFDRYAESTKDKRGTAEVDDAFLDEIEGWRELLARNIALRNPGLAARELNFAVQRTIDRIIFLRICEDRGIEPYGQLQALLNGARRLRPPGASSSARPTSATTRACSTFTPEKGRAEAPDDADPGAGASTTRSLKDIISSLYYPDSPYEFSVLPRRHPGPGLRAVPGQGHPPDRRPPGQGRGQARGAQGGRRLLHAHLHRRLHRRRTRWASCWRARRPKQVAPSCASSIRPAAPARS